MPQGGRRHRGAPRPPPRPRVARGAVAAPAPWGQPCPPPPSAAEAATPGPLGTHAAPFAGASQRAREGQPGDAQVGRFSGFLIARFPRMHHAHRRPRKNAAGWPRGVWGPGKLAIWRSAEWLFTRCSKLSQCTQCNEDVSPSLMQEARQTWPGSSLKSRQRTLRPLCVYSAQRP